MFNWENLPREIGSITCHKFKLNTVQYEYVYSKSDNQVKIELLMNVGAGDNVRAR